MHPAAKCAALLASAMLTSSCGTLGNSLPDDSVVLADQGVIVLKLSSDVEGLLRYSQPGRYGAYGGFSVKTGEEYVVKVANAGEFRWSQFVSRGSIAWLRSLNRFEIRPGQITYVGHIDLSTSDGIELRFGVADREGDVKAYLRQHYPKFMGSMPFGKAITQIHDRSQRSALEFSKPPV